jgi:hypothetical protein
MSDARRPPVTIPQDLMLARLAQSEQMREFFIQMWLRNPVPWQNRAALGWRTCLRLPARKATRTRSLRPEFAANAGSGDAPKEVPLGDTAKWLAGIPPQVLHSWQR